MLWYEQCKGLWENIGRVLTQLEVVKEDFLEEVSELTWKMNELSIEEICQYR